MLQCYNSSWSPDLYQVWTQHVWVNRHDPHCWLASIPGVTLSSFFLYGFLWAAFVASGNYMYVIVQWIKRETRDISNYIVNVNLDFWNFTPGFLSLVSYLYRWTRSDFAWMCEYEKTRTLATRRWKCFIFVITFSRKPQRWAFHVRFSKEDDGTGRVVSRLHLHVKSSYSIIDLFTVFAAILASRGSSSK